MEENMIPLYLMVGILIVFVLVQVVHAVVRLLDPNYRRSLKVRRMAKIYLQKKGHRRVKFDETNVLQDDDTVYYYVGFEKPAVTVKVNLSTGTCTIE